MKVTNRAGHRVEVSCDAIKRRIRELCELSAGEGDVGREDMPEDIDDVVIRTITGIYDGIPTSHLDELSARECASLQTVHHGYEALAGRILMSNLHKNAHWKIRPPSSGREEDEEALLVGNDGHPPALERHHGGHHHGHHHHHRHGAGSSAAASPSSTTSSDSCSSHRYYSGAGGLRFSEKVAFLCAHQPNAYAEEVADFVRAYAADLDAMIDYTRDYRYGFFSVCTLERGYLQKVDDVCIESPQDMWMRVAVAIHCPRRGGEYDAAETLARIRETFDLMSNGDFTHATPSLFNMGTRFEQGSSCYLLGVDDSLAGIYKCLSDCAQISKWAGGIGLHVSNVRAYGSRIRSTNGRSDGIVPMLRVFNETGRYCNQSGRRKGSIAIYLEPWHADVWDFVELRRNTGKEERRARDLFLALWVPDLFMCAVRDNRDWYLMSADVAVGLTDAYGDAFDALYARYVAEGKYVGVVKARALWGHILQCQMETGTPYVLFKDHVNRKCNQQNIGTIRSSNLCAEITEYSDDTTYAVCNLASIAVNRFVRREAADAAHRGLRRRVAARDEQEADADATLAERMDLAELHRVAKVVTRNLNRIIDINFYPTPETRSSNMHLRPIGIGVQGTADMFIALGLAYGSEAALALEALVMETIYHGALEASVELAAAHGPYAGFEGSPFSRGELQMDLWERAHGGGSDGAAVRYSGLWDWDALRARVRAHGTRNSMLTALMPTASTSQILGNNECFEPVHGFIFKRRTMAGEFKVANKEFMKDMMALGLWTDAVRRRVIDGDGSVQSIADIPARLKDVYKTAFDVRQAHIIDHAVARGPFVDQSQSMNLYFATNDSDRLNRALFRAWIKGLKTGMYYYRSHGQKAVNYGTGTSGMSEARQQQQQQQQQARQGGGGGVTERGGGGGARSGAQPRCEPTGDDGACLMCSA